MRSVLSLLLPGGLFALPPRRNSRLLLLAAVLAAVGLTIPAAAPAGEEEEVFELIEGTAILLNQSSDGGGSGGNTKTTSSSTNVFAPAAYVDYKRFGGEPTVTVDRYPFLAGQFPGMSGFRDITYQSAPNGIPSYSQFWKSDDLAATFRKPGQVPVHGLEVAATPGGGGDSHQVVGHVTHKVYFTDLPLHCVYINTSRDLGETFTPDNLGCGVEEGLDDRQWVEEDEEFGPNPCPPGAPPAVNCGNVYVSFINFALITQPTLSFARSHTGASTGSFAVNSLCNTATMDVPITGADDDEPTVCPDPADERLQVAGPPVADKSPASPNQHNIYIPFIRGTPIIPGLTAGPPYDLYIARSTNGGETWTRHLVANLGDHNPINIFPQLTIDRVGNLYYTWSQTQESAVVAESGFVGEQDVYYTFSRGGGLEGTWATPINLTKERNDTAIFPWMIAGDPGRVDLVLYKANTGINSNFAFVDAEGNECEEGDAGCVENRSAWNVYFSQSLNALSTAPNFKTVQVSAAPNHIGQACTLGLACEGDRSLLDFFTVDVDHLGAAVIAYSDTNYSLGISRDHTTRQIAGTSVFKNQNITLQNSWPILDHAVFDRAGDVFNSAGLPTPCPSMDILKTTADREGTLVTITLTLGAPPTAADATLCGGGASNGGVWGAEFWAQSVEDDEPTANHYYIAFRHDLLPPRVEGGAMDNFNAAVTSLDFQDRTDGTLGGTCFPQMGPPPTGACTIAMTVDVSTLGITPGNALLSLTGVSAYFFGAPEEAPLTRLLLGSSEQADATAAIHVLGSGTP